MALQFYFIAGVLVVVICLFNSDRDATTFFDYINSRHPNIKFTMVKQVNHNLPFFDVLINYFSFTSYSYKMGLIKTLVDRAYKINNTWLGFHEGSGLRSHVVYKFLCAGCNACYITEYCRNLESTWLVTGPLTFSSIRKILHIFALCVQQITSMF